MLVHFIPGNGIINTFFKTTKDSIYKKLYFQYENYRRRIADLMPKEYLLPQETSTPNYLFQHLKKIIIRNQIKIIDLNSRTLHLHKKFVLTRRDDSELSIITLTNNASISSINTIHG
jgi:hypothetical protein